MGKWPCAAPSPGRASREATVDECIEVAKTHDGTVILISVAGDVDGGDTQQMLRRATQALVAPIVVLRDGEELRQVRSVLQAGARGYISTSMSLDVAIEALGSFERVVSTFRRAASLEWEMPIRLGQPRTFSPPVRHIHGAAGCSRHSCLPRQSEQDHCPRAEDEGEHRKGARPQHYEKA